MDTDETTTLERLNAIRQQERSPEPRGGATPAVVRHTAERLGIRLLAAGKDGLDWALDFLLIGEIPIVGQLPGIGYSALLALHLVRSGWLRQPGLKTMLFAAALIADNLPLANNLPLTFLATFLIGRG